MSRLAGATLVAMTLSSSFDTSAYDIPNHFDMSRGAILASDLNRDANSLRKIGIHDLDQTLVASDDADFAAFTDGCSHGKALSIIDLVACGAEFEDFPASRPLNHFFDPTSNSPLTVCIPPVPLPGPSVELGMNSPDWALQDREETITSAQAYSYKNARDEFFGALTTPGLQTAREPHWGKLFQTLGQVIHHLQDMAQPQHVRNDEHLPANVPIPGYSNPSLYEAFTAGPEGRPAVRAVINASTIDPVYPSATPGEFRLPRDFWKNASGSGIAEFTNQNFVSYGTNFQIYGGERVDVGQYPLPQPGTPRDASIGELTPPLSPDIVSDCGSSPACTMTFYSTNDDNPATANLRASALSIFDQYLRSAPATYTYNGTCSWPTFRVDRLFALNRYTFVAAYPLLIPRAVAYSAGLINYFFRGQLQIGLPDEGVYGVIDHGDPTSSDPVTGGFPRIKVKLQNVTPGLDAQGNPGIEPLVEGTTPTLVAVAKFHRNTCYAADLSGEYGSLDADGLPLVDWQNWHPDARDGCGRSPMEEIVVSDPAPVPVGINAAPQDVAFTFQNRIPISATDLYLQVVYRGPLGQEPNAVVVATKDISEPTYGYNYSRWDQYRYACPWPRVESTGDPGGCGGDYSYAQWCVTGGFPSQASCDQAMGLTFKHQFSPTSAAIPGYDPKDNPAVPPDTFVDISRELPFTPVATMPAPVGALARIAVLTDATPTNAALLVMESVDTTHDNRQFKWLPATAQATVNQLDSATNTLTPSVTYMPGRGVFLPAGENTLLNSGAAHPLLILGPSQVSCEFIGC